MGNPTIDLSKSVDELDPPSWGEPKIDTYLVKTCHKLRQKPLSKFNVEDLRIMIGQNTSLSLLVPLAIDVLKTNPLAEGGYYPGDLLYNVLRVNRGY